MAESLFAAGSLVNLVEHRLVLWAQLDVLDRSVVGGGRSLASESLLNVSFVVNEPLDVGGDNLKGYQVSFIRSTSRRCKDILYELCEKGEEDQF